MQVPTWQRRAARKATQIDLEANSLERVRALRVVSILQVNLCQVALLMDGPTVLIDLALFERYIVAAYPANVISLLQGRHVCLHSESSRCTRHVGEMYFLLVYRVVCTLANIMQFGTSSQSPFAATWLPFPVPRKQRAVMLVESALHLGGWFLGPLGFWIYNNPVALRTSPSRKGIAF